MKKPRLVKVALTCALAVACVCGLAACGQKDADAGADIDVNDTSEGVAATVNGTEIGEKAITSYVANFRTMSQMEDDATWSQWLVDNDYTVEAMREQVINYYVSQSLIRQAAEENDVTVDPAEVDSQVSTMRAYYDNDEDWQTALQQAGTTEVQYRSLLELSLMQQALQSKVAQAVEPTDEELLQYAQMYAMAYSGAKKSSHILFAASDEKTAQEVLDKINAGELDFAEGAKEYSTDEASAVDGGNVGWDRLTTFADEYQQALDGLEAGQVSGLVTSQFGIHIIKCTEVFNAPEEVTAIDQVPSEFVDSIKGSLEASSKEQSYADWYASYKEKADIQINDMPEGLPYAVDLSNVTKTESDTATAGVPDAKQDFANDSTDAPAEDEAAGSRRCRTASGKCRA